MSRPRFTTPSIALTAILCLLGLAACGSGGASASNTHQGGSNAPTATTAPSGPSGLAGSWWGQEQPPEGNLKSYWYFQIADASAGQLQIQATVCHDPTAIEEYYTNPAAVPYVPSAISQFTLLDIAHQIPRYQVQGTFSSASISLTLVEVDTGHGNWQVTLSKGSKDVFMAACKALPSL